MVREEFQLLLNCGTCGVPCEVWPNQMPRPWPGSDVEATAIFEAECEECGQTTEVTVTADLSGWLAHVSGDPETHVQVNHYDYSEDDWLEDLEPELHPFTNYKAASREWRKHLRELGETDDASGRNRMLLVQLFSIVEAYLSDAVIGIAHEFPDVLNSIVAWHPDLKEEKVSLSSVAANPNFVRDMVISRLRRTQFHRFEHVNGMLRAALQHHFLPSDKEARRRVLESAKIRHFCVHRNGRDQDGNLVSGITDRYLLGLVNLFDEMLLSLRNRIEEVEIARRKRFPDQQSDEEMPWDDSEI